MPGAYGLKGAVQDWRYYLGTALTADEVRKVAMDTVVDGYNLRTCEMWKEGGDQIWSDINGHDCAWYQEMRKVDLRLIVLACGALTHSARLANACLRKDFLRLSLCVCCPAYGSRRYPQSA
jgi:hypothetical protein